MLSPMRHIQASDLGRVMNCGGFLALGAFSPSDDAQTKDQIEGNAAHRVMELSLNGTVSHPTDLIDRKVNHNYIVTPPMVEYLSTHIELIQSRNLPILTEEKTDWSTSIAGNTVIRGRGDIITWDQVNKILYIDDLKYGFRIVEPEMNWTLISHAIGLTIRNGWKPERVVFTIHQPRQFHIDGVVRKWEIDAPTVQMLHAQIDARFENLPSTVTTGQHCYKCPAAYPCPASRLSAAASVDISTDAYNEELNGDQIGFELSVLERAADAIKLRKGALESLAENRMRDGKSVTGYGMKPSEGNRQLLDHIDATTIAIVTGLPVEKLSKQETLSPAQLEKAGVPKDVVNSFCFRPSRGFRIVKEDTDKQAKKLFGN